MRGSKVRLGVRGSVAVCCNVANTTMKLLLVTAKYRWGTKEICKTEKQKLIC